MTRQGRCVLPADESGRILDRLAGLEQVITPTVIRQVLWETGRLNARACTLTHEVMLWVVLAMGILTNFQSDRCSSTLDDCGRARKRRSGRVCVWPGNDWGSRLCDVCSK